MTPKSCLQHWSRCAKPHQGRNVSMQAPDEPFAKFPGTCKSHAPTHTKSSCGFGALNPCGAAPLAHPPFPKWISASTYHQQAQSRFGSTLHSHLLSSHIQILPTTWSALALRQSKASTEPTAHCRERNPKSGSESICKRRRGWMRGWGGEEGRK